MTEQKKLEDFMKSIPDLTNWAKSMEKQLQGQILKQPKVVEKCRVKIGAKQVSVTLCDNGAIAIEFPDQKSAEKWFNQIKESK